MLAVPPAAEAPAEIAPPKFAGATAVPGGVTAAAPPVAAACAVVAVCGLDTMAVLEGVPVVGPPLGANGLATSPGASPCCVSVGSSSFLAPSLIQFAVALKEAMLKTFDSHLTGLLPTILPNKVFCFSSAPFSPSLLFLLAASSSDFLAAASSSAFFAASSASLAFFLASAAASSAAGFSLAASESALALASAAASFTTDSSRNSVASLFLVAVSAATSSLFAFVSLALFNLFLTLFSAAAFLLAISA